MNIVDVFVIFIMSMSTIIGVYNGFIVSVLQVASLFVSWIGALIFYPVLSKLILNIYPELHEKIVFYSDGSSNIASVEDRLLNISILSPEYLESLFQNIRLPNPFVRILSVDVFKSSQQMNTLGEFFDATVANVIINIISFLILFFILQFLFNIAVSIAKVIKQLPVLKQFDSLFGAGLGLLRGFFILYFIFAVIPIFLALAPVDIISEYLDTSMLGQIFYRSNIFTNFVRGGI